jgi:hypothetical protein
VSENRVLRRIFRPKREELARGWRRLHNEELHNLYFSRNAIKMLKSRSTRLPGHVARVVKMRNAHGTVIANPEAKRPLGRTRHRRENNIQIDLKEMLCEGVDWIKLAPDRVQWRNVVNTAMNIWVP